MAWDSITQSITLYEYHQCTFVLSHALLKLTCLRYCWLVETTNIYKKRFLAVLSIKTMLYFEFHFQKSLKTPLKLDKTLTADSLDIWPPSLHLSITTYIKVWIIVLWGTSVTSTCGTLWVWILAKHCHERDNNNKTFKIMGHKYRN